MGENVIDFVRDIRERVLKSKEDLDPDDFDWMFTDDVTMKEAVAYFALLEAKHIPDIWCQMLGARIMDPDGWRYDKKDWYEPISKKEFDRRMQLCTIDMTGYVPYRPKV